MEITALIGTLGFPIVAYLMIYLDLRKVILKQSEILNEILILLKP